MAKTISLQDTIEWVESQKFFTPIGSGQEPSISIVRDVMNLILNQELRCFCFTSKKAVDGNFKQEATQGEVK